MDVIDDERVPKNWHTPRLAETVDNGWVKFNKLTCRCGRDWPCPFRDLEFWSVAVIDPTLFAMQQEMNDAESKIVESRAAWMKPRVIDAKAGEPIASPVWLWVIVLAIGAVLFGLGQCRGHRTPTPSEGGSRPPHAVVAV